MYSQPTNSGRIAKKYTDRMRLDPGPLGIQEIATRFDRAADTFDQADYVHRASFDGLLDRLQPVSVDAGLIVDLGAASGAGSAALAARFRKARVIGVDASAHMLRQSMRRRSLLSKVRAIQADACALPFKDNSADLIVANMLLPWIGDPDRCFAEVNRVLRKEGVFAFATLGPDSMSEFKTMTETCRFPDMHDVGDGLVQAGLQDPVLDVERLRVTWGSMDELANDMLACGAIGGEADLLRASESSALPRDEDGRFAIDLELVFGHAWGSGPRPTAGEFRIEAASIGRRGRAPG